MADTYYEHLAQIPLFEGLDRHDLELVGRATTELTIDAGHVLMREGGTAHEMVVVLNGTLEVTRGGKYIADIGPGGFAGEMALLTHSHRNSTVTSKTKVTVLHIDGRAFSSVLDEAPRIALKMLPIVAGRITENSASHTN